MRVIRVLGAGFLVLLLGLVTLIGWRRYQESWRWRELTPAIRDFLAAAQARDSGTLRRLSTDSEPIARTIALAEQQPAQLDTILASLAFAWGDELGPDTVVVTFHTRASTCHHADGHSDEFQARFVGAAGQRRIDYAAIVPC